MPDHGHNEYLNKKSAMGNAGLDPGGPKSDGKTKTETTTEEQSIDDNGSGTRKERSWEHELLKISALACR